MKSNRAANEEPEEGIHAVVKNSLKRRDEARLKYRFGRTTFDVVTLKPLEAFHADN